MRYHPSAAQEGDIAAWTRHVREVVRRFGANPRRGGAADRQRGEPHLLAGLLRRRLRRRARGAGAGRDRGQGRGPAARARPARDRLQLGLPHRPRRARRASGARCAIAAGPRSCARSTGSASTPTRARCSRRPSPHRPTTATGWSTRMSTMRCFARIPGIPRHGADEGGGERLAHLPRSLARRCRRYVLEAMVSAVHDFRGTYNVTDYRWFNLRDGDTVVAPAVPALRPVRQRLRGEARLRRLPAAGGSARARRARAVAATAADLVAAEVPPRARRPPAHMRPRPGAGHDRGRRPRTRPPRPLPPGLAPLPPGSPRALQPDRPPPRAPPATPPRGPGGGADARRAAGAGPAGVPGVPLASPDQAVVALHRQHPRDRVVQAPARDLLGLRAARSTAT